MMMRWPLQFGWMAACAVLLSCSALEKPPENHSWHHPNPERDCEWPESATLKDSEYSEVRVTALHTAISRLENTPFIELDPDVVNHYAPASFRVPQGKRAFLVRSLYSNETGGYSLYYWKGKLSVAHFSLGSSFHPKPLPLVVLLNSAPVELFVTYGGAR